MQLVNAEIIDDRTEYSCSSNDSCSWVQYQNKRFDFYDNRWITNQEFTKISREKLNDDLTYEFLDNSSVTITPVLSINGNLVRLRDSNSLFRESLGYQQFLVSKRFYNKFYAEFNTQLNLDRIGYQISSNYPITAVTYEYLREGVYITNESLPYVNVTDLYIGKLKFSFVDLVEAGYNIEFDRKTNTIWIFLEDKEGRIRIDPIEYIFSDNPDGHCVRAVVGGCSSCISGTSTNLIGKQYPLGGSNTRYIGVVTFNTSSLGDLGVTQDDIDLAQVRIYSQQYINQFNCGGIPSNHNVRYDFKSIVESSLTCSDYNSFPINGAVYDWGTSTGWKFALVNISSVNVTGDSDYSLNPLWSDCSAQRQRRTHTWRASEYSDPDYGPHLNITYNLMGGDNFVGNMKRSVFPLVLLLSMILISMNGGKNDIKKEE